MAFNLVVVKLPAVEKMTLAAAAATHSINRCFLDPTMELRWATRRSRSPNTKSLKFPPSPPSSPRPSAIPLYISSNSSHASPRSVLDLLLACNLSCDRFPDFGHEDRVVLGEDFLKKLRIALANSSVVVSVFCRSEDVIGGNDDGAVANGGELGFGSFMRRVVPSVGPQDGKLVGFGRAVSDLGLTASIYDVMVTPPLRGMGIGKMVVKRLVRILTSKDIFDIAALCSESQRPFFKACGFGDDFLGSTAMMYAKTVSTSNSEDQLVKCAGRKLLLVPVSKRLGSS